MAKKQYLQRICDRLVQQKLETSGAVLIEGPKWCGKTWTGKNAAKSVLYMQEPDKSPAYLKLAETMPSRLLQGDKPRLIDEWQEAPVLWDAVRFDVDQSGEWGQYILTGSAVPREDLLPKHTGTGRIARLRMRTMSLYESLESNGQISLQALFNGEIDVIGESKLTIPELAQIICRGGWPEAVGKRSMSEHIARNYVDAVVTADIQRVDGVERNPQRVQQLLRSYARNISTLATFSTILEDIKAKDPLFSEPTLYNYLNALRRIFLIEDIPAWKPSLRSKTAIRTSDKRQFIDPSIAAAVLGADANTLLDDFEYFGFLFESLVTRDLRIYAQANDGEIFHYRDKDNLEVDLIIRLRNGRWGAVEVKLGSREIEDGAKNLLTLKQKVNAEHTGEPAFLMIVTGGEFAYRREDGVLVVPLGCLKD